MNRLLVHAIQLKAEVDPEFFKTRTGGDTFYEVIDWIGSETEKIHNELMQAAADADIQIVRDYNPQDFAANPQLASGMRNSVFFTILNRFIIFEANYTRSTERIKQRLTVHQSEPSVTSAVSSTAKVDTVKILKGLNNSSVAIAQESRRKLTGFAQLVSEIKERAKERYARIASFNKPLSAQLSSIYLDILKFNTSDILQTDLTVNTKQDLDEAKEELERITNLQRRVTEQLLPNHSAKNAKTTFDRLELLVKEFNKLCKIEEQKYTRGMYDVADPSVSKLAPIREKLAELTRLNDELLALEQAPSDQPLKNLNTTILVANLQSVLLDICTLLQAQHQKGIVIFTEFKQLMMCRNAVKFGCYRFLVDQDLSKVHQLVRWFTSELRKAVDSRFFQGRKFHPITSELIPHEFRSYSTEQNQDRDLQACMIQLEHIHQRMFSLVQINDQQDLQNASEKEKISVARGILFCLVAAGLVTQQIAEMYHYPQDLAKQYSDSTTQLMGVNHPPQRGKFFKAGHSIRTTPLLTYLACHFKTPVGKNHCMALIDQLTKMDMELVTWEFVTVDKDTPAPEWNFMGEHVRALLNCLAKKHLFMQSELGASNLNNPAQTALVVCLPEDAYHTYISLSELTPPFEIAPSDEAGRALIPYLHRVLWDLSQGEFRNVFIDVHESIGHTRQNLLEFMNRYAITPEQITVMNNVYRIMGNVLSWKSWGEIPQPQWTVEDQSYNSLQFM